MTNPSRQDVAATALLVQPFTAYVLALRWLTPPTERNWELADPILKLMGREPTLWSVPVLALVLLAWWWKAARPSPEVMRRGVRHAGIGFCIALTCVTVLRLVNGSHLPAFIPAEENAGPGYLLSMTAGYGEELLFRLGLLPLVYFWLLPRVPRAVSLGLSMVITGLGFALLHAAGPEPFSAPYFAVRFIMPGCFMSFMALRVSFPGIAVAHCASHLLLPVLFD